MNRRAALNRTVAVLLVAAWVITVMPFLMVFYVIGWIWCCAVDGFRLAQMTYEKYRETIGEIEP